MHDHSLLIVSSDTSAKGKALNMDAYPGASIRIGIFSCIPWTRCRCNWASEGPGAHGVHARETKLMLTRELTHTDTSNLMCLPSAAHSFKKVVALVLDTSCCPVLTRSHSVVIGMKACTKSFTVTSPAGTSRPAWRQAALTNERGNTVAPENPAMLQQSFNAVYSSTS